MYIKDFCTAIINMTNVTSSDLSAEPQHHSQVMIPAG